MVLGKRDFRNFRPEAQSPKPSPGWAPPPDFVEDLRRPLPPRLFHRLHISDLELGSMHSQVRAAQPPPGDPEPPRLVAGPSQKSEDSAKKDELTQLMREKLYLENRRLNKFGRNGKSFRRVGHGLLKGLLRDCDLTRDSQTIDPPAEDVQVSFLDSPRKVQLALQNWGLDWGRCSGTLQIPGLLSLAGESDLTLLDSKTPRKKVKAPLPGDSWIGAAYVLDPLRLPKVSAEFEEIDFGNFSFETEQRTGKAKTASKYRKEKKTKKEVAKAKKTELQLVRTARMSHQDKRRVRVARNECFQNFGQIERKMSEHRQKALLEISGMGEERREEHKKRLVVRVWGGVCASVVKIQRFFQKDSEQNARKLGLLCAKERRKMLAKSKKHVKDYVLRAKRLNKEAIVYWKRRGKELSDLKKKREKIQGELRRKEDERREQRKQKKKIEYLIKQSDIYAHIMAEKLGIREEGRKKEPGPPGLLTQEEVQRARQKVNGMIRQNQERVQALQQEMRKDAVTEPLNGHEPAPQSVNFDFSKIELDEKSTLISTPTSFRGQLKEYQLKGLRWLNNLFEQGINGILADEMGLGKTVQAIALMTHVAEHKACWGPFLVIAPTITLFNWQNECSKFSPQLKVLPYWGSKKDREVLRKSFRQKFFGARESSSHVVITSYSFAVRDFKYLDRVRWQYVILDEAQAIKNIRSQRWSTLLSLKSRNKLLLTGTPIQNTMAELWALLHFIMPQLFDSHEEFQEWFSKDIEAHSKNKQGFLNKTQLNRLHAILKPFMLRRVKKDVEKEIGRKIVSELVCDMSSRQKLLYNNIKKRICLSDLMQMYENKQKAQNLMNLVMQFRKVCNHPELFERKIERTALVFARTLESNLHFVYSRKPNMKFLISNDHDHPFRLRLPLCVFGLLDGGSFGVDLDLHGGQAAILGLSRVWANLLMKGDEQSLLEFVTSLHYISRRQRLATCPLRVFRHVEDSAPDPFTRFLSKKTCLSPALPEYSPNISFQGRKFDSRTRLLEWDMSEIPVEQRRTIVNTRSPISSVLSLQDPQSLCSLRRICQIYIPKVVSVRHNPRNLSRSPRDRRLKETLKLPSLYRVEFPTIYSLISESSKLKTLDNLLGKLKQKKHRVLIFCQMTKMMNIIEDYLQFRKYKYYRLDGGSGINERRDMVDGFQSRSDIFVFLLSTRAGGLGVTLTAADDVIFYDNDWNPTMDAQAEDRAHRIGTFGSSRPLTRRPTERRLHLQAGHQEHHRGAHPAAGPAEAERPEDRLLGRGLQGQLLLLERSREPLLRRGRAHAAQEGPQAGQGPGQAEEEAGPPGGQGSAPAGGLLFPAPKGLEGSGILERLF